jgi:hypothetical protein
MHLDVVVQHNQERWGTVEVISAEPRAYLAVPYDRANKDFFARLEERMRTDPSPPPGVILVPVVEPAIEDAIHWLVGMEDSYDTRR